ncbi:uncharacterized protein LOC143277627 isoform X2 [Babylonia areolata]|uniref:uncharacterized protein LOC143277627 isoform X2 n=1 Tax=Babylonia areolata TaxID=304850 RepID=UPI003FD534B1
MFRNRTLSSRYTRLISFVILTMWNTSIAKSRERTETDSVQEDNSEESAAFSTSFPLNDAAATFPTSFPSDDFTFSTSLSLNNDVDTFSSSLPLNKDAATFSTSFPINDVAATLSTSLPLNHHAATLSTSFPLTDDGGAKLSLMGHPVNDDDQCITQASITEASTDNNNTSTGLNTSRFDCFLQLHVPQGSVTLLQTGSCSGVGVLAWRRNEGGQRVCPDHHKLSSCPELNPDTHGVTTNNTVTSPYHGQWRRPVLCFNFAFVNSSSAAPGLKVVFLTSSLGYIQTPRHINKHYNSCAILTPPPGQMIFVSVNKSSSPRVSFARFQSPCGPIKYPIRDLRLPFIFPDLQTFVVRMSWYLRNLVVSDTEDGQNWNGTRPLTLLYVTQNSGSQSMGLVFSFQQRRPVSTSYQWNCSKSEWPELYRHFPCDGQLQCLGGEDETHCYYHSDDCGAGKITVDGSCFIIIRESYWATTTRSEAEQKCERQGAMLASFDSFRQWDSLVSTLQDMGHRKTHLWIDMHSVRSTMKTSEDTYMKNMYINTWQWGSGGSVVYNFHASFHQECNQAYLSTTANDLQKRAPGQYKQIRRSAKCPRHHQTASPTTTKSSLKPRLTWLPRHVYRSRPALPGT